VKQYIGFAQGQVKQIETKPEGNKKKIYNVLRLLLEAKRVMNGEEPKVWIEGEEREMLMAVRNEEKPLAEYLQQAKEMVKEIEAHKPWKNLPDKVDEEWLDNWLLALRSKQWQEEQEQEQSQSQSHG
jgi:hypothetical protein